MGTNTTPSDLPTSQADYYTDLAVGEILRRTRLHYNQSLDDVANYLRIRTGQLEAIEKGDMSKLPGRVYVIGYIRTYSEYLGLDGEKMVHLFKQQAGGKSTKPELHFPVPASESKAPNLYIIFGSLAVLGLVVGVWVVLYAFGKGHNAVEPVAASDIPAVPAELKAEAKAALPAPPAPAPVSAQQAGVQSPTPIQPETQGVQSQPAVPAGNAVTPQTTQQTGATVADGATTAALNAAAATTAAPAPAQKKEVVITIKERSWVEVRDKEGNTILSRILKPGEIFIVPESNYGLRLDTGNAGGIALTVNGQPYPALGKEGDILRGFVLDGNKLLQKLAPAQPVR